MSVIHYGTGTVKWLCINGEAVGDIHFSPDGPDGDKHTGFIRKLSGHDGDYMKSSELKSGDWVLNWRSWTAIEQGEIAKVEESLGVKIPQGCLLENIMFEGISGFSTLPPTSRLVFPEREGGQAILAIWEENGPCATVGQRLANHYANDTLRPFFIKKAKKKRGVMGMVLSSGKVVVGDTVEVYLPN